VRPISPLELYKLEEKAWFLKKRENLKTAEALDLIASERQYKNWEELTRNVKFGGKVYDTIADFIEKANQVGVYFSLDNMEAFGSTIEGEIYTNPRSKEQFFIISSEGKTEREYIIKRALPDGRVGTLEDHVYGNLADAVKAIRKLCKILTIV